MRGRRGPLLQRPCLPFPFRAPSTRFSPGQSQRHMEGRLPKPSPTPTRRPWCCAPPRERSVLRGEKQWEREQESGDGGVQGFPAAAAHFTAFPSPRGVEMSRPGCPLAWAQQGPPSPAQPGSRQPPPLPAALRAPTRRADLINQRAEQPSPALTAPQPCSRVPLRFSERNSVEKKIVYCEHKAVYMLYTYITNLFIAIYKYILHITLLHR